MKLRLRQHLVLLILSVIALNCRKDSTINTAFTSDLAATEIKTWLKAQSDTALVNKTLKDIKLNEAFTLPADSGSYYFIAPLIDTSKSPINEEKKLSRFIIIEKSISENTNGYLYGIFATPAELANHKNALLKGFATVDFHFDYDGTLSKFTLNGTFTESTIYSAGKIKAYSKLYLKNKSGRVAIQNIGKKKADEVCVDWYLVTTYSDGHQIWQYLFSDCTCDAQMTSMNKQGTFTVKSMCGGGAAGSPPSGSGTGCVVQGTSIKIKNNKMTFDVGEPCTAPVPVPKIKYTPCSSMSTAKHDEVVNLLQAIQSSTACLVKALVNDVSASTIDICSSDTLSVIAESPAPDLIIVSGTISVSESSMREELFHLDQRKIYGSGLKYANAEFEADILNDLLENDPKAIPNMNDDERKKYLDWLNQLNFVRLTSNPQTIDQMLPTTELKNQYFELLNLYAAKRNISSNEINNNLLPGALLNLMSQQCQ